MRFLLFFLISTLFACTDFVVEAQDGSLINGRSLEFGLDLNSKIRLFPKNQQMRSLAPNQKPGLTWVTKYGYIGVNCLNLNFSFDGMNEAGLSFGYLWLPNITEYPTVSAEEMSQALDFTDFCAWVLGNFSTVNEVKEALKEVRIWGHPVPPIGMAPVHAAIHDAKGDNIVVEFINGEMKVYDNPISILTNAPSFDWQIANLQNYLNLGPNNPDPITFRDVNIQVPGQGGGFLGMPGDFSPASRFVKIFTLLRLSQNVAKGIDGVNLAEHLLNSVDIPVGVIRDPGKESGDYTQWIVVKDMTQKVFYFRSYGDLVLKKIDMKRINFSKVNKNSLSIDLKKGYLDVTDALGGTGMTVMNESLE